jgi:hypothetical protein
MSITLCTHSYLKYDKNGNAVICDTEEEADYVNVYFSGIYNVGGRTSNVRHQIPLRIERNGKSKFFVSRRDANTIYERSIFPDQQMLDQIYSNTNTSGKVINRSVILLNELISKTEFNLSTIISIFNLHDSNKPKIFIVEACREYLGDDADIEARLGSSESEQSSEQSNESDEVVVAPPFLAYKPPPKSAQPPNVDYKVFKKKPPIKKIKMPLGSEKKSSRAQKQCDSLQDLPKSAKKGSRIIKGKFDSLASLGKNVAGKKTRKNRKNKRK